MATILLLGLVPAVVRAWQVSPGPGSGAAVAVDGAGDVIAVGSLTSPVTGTDFAVVKLSGTDGAVRWQWTASAGTDPYAESERAYAVLVDGGGDLIVGGWLRPTTFGEFRLLVVKLAGADGTELWRYEGDGFVLDLAFDPTGDVIARGGDGDGTLLVAKLAAATGAELWRSVVAGIGNATHGLACAANGDVVAAGSTAVRLRASDGTELWRGGGSTGSGIPAHGLVLDANGDVLMAREIIGFPYHDVTKLLGSDGATVWTTDFGVWRDPEQVALVPGGDLLVAMGLLTGGSPSAPAAVARLSGATGAELWRHEMPPGGAFGRARAVVIDAGVRVLVAGVVRTNTSGDHDALVAELSLDGAERWERLSDRFGPATTQSLDTDFDGWEGVAAHPAGGVVVTGTVTDHGVVGFAVERVRAEFPGRRLLVRDAGGNPTRRRLVVQGAGPGLRVAAPRGPADPTLAGGQLDLFNPTSGEAVHIALPASNWHGLGSPPGSSGYVYQDGALAVGPCKKVTIRKAGPESVKAQCQGAGLAFTLDEPAQGSLGVRLTTGAGADAITSCMLFGGTVLRDIPSAAGHVGIFNARNAPAPAAACP